MTIPFRHLTGQSIGWRELGSSPPRSAFLEPLEWVAPGACWKEWSAWGALTLIGEHLEDDESSFEVAVFKGPLGVLLEGAAEPLDAIFGDWRNP